MKRLHRHRAFTLVEILITSVILLFLAGVVMATMIAYGKVEKSMRVQMHVQDGSRKLTTQINYLLATATNIQVRENGERDASKA